MPNNYTELFFYAKFYCEKSKDLTIGKFIDKLLPIRLCVIFFVARTYHFGITNTQLAYVRYVYKFNYTNLVVFASI